ncbi:rCG29125 [Rattus norvegicus]|uniref:RCG29125 n=1 Tax=Rattus norvegicus TaxID=10116 RepID=A6KS91_RAT|nr:rCG29125 [Rattus norvegicus]
MILNGLPFGTADLCKEALTLIDPKYQSTLKNENVMCPATSNIQPRLNSLC